MENYYKYFFEAMYDFTNFCVSVAGEFGIDYFNSLIGISKLSGK